MRTILVGALLLVGACRGSDEPAAALPELPKPTVVPAYELIQNSGPLVILMAGNIQDTLYTALMSSVTSDLIGAGYSVLALDLPCHAPGESGHLTCWRERIEGGDTELFTGYCSGLSAVLDELGEIEVSAVGQSRGGYLAVTCAAYDSRLRNIALLAPVTDLQRLEEFDRYAVDQSVFGLSKYVSFIRDRQFFVRIAERDSRVGTDAAVDFAHSVSADLQLVSGDMHGPPDNGATLAWLLDRF